MVAYFFDTYAFIELIKGNKNYSKFIGSTFRTSIFNLYELYYNLLKERGEDVAKTYFEKYFNFVIEPNKQDIFSASKFKFEMSKSNISYVDALGYSMAKLNGYKFLTGDKEFEDLDNVEFVK